MTGSLNFNQNTERVPPSLVVGSNFGTDPPLTRMKEKTPLDPLGPPSGLECADAIFTFRSISKFLHIPVDSCCNVLGV